MTDKEQAYFDSFAINEGAYFYHRNFDIDKREVRKIFATIKDNAHDHTNIVEIIKEPVAFADGRSALCTLKVFQDKTIFVNAYKYFNLWAVPKLIMLSWFKTTYEMMVGMNDYICR